MNPKTRKWLMIGALVAAGLCVCIVIAGVTGALLFQARTTGQTFSTVFVATKVFTFPQEGTLPVERTAAPTAALPAVDFEGVHFNYDPALATSVKGKVVEAQMETGIPYWELLPRHLSFEFEGYPRTGVTFHQAEVLVYPVEEYIKANEGVRENIEALQQALENRPTEFDSDAPFLPAWNAAQMLHAQLRYLDNGIRYVTQYGQDVSPISNERVFYTYQGFAGNGMYYVTAIFPIRSAALPDTGEVDDYETFAIHYQEYLGETRALLDAEPSENFEPDLDLLDALVESIIVK